MSAIWIDPMRLALPADHVGGGSSFRLVRQNYGSDAHYAALARSMRSQLGRHRDRLIVDLLPFDRLGNRTAFLRHLVGPGLLDTALLLVSSRTLVDDLQSVAQGNGRRFEVVEFAVKGNELEVVRGIEPVHQVLAGIPQQLGQSESSVTYSRLRASVNEARVTRAVKGVTLKPPDERWLGGVERVGDTDFFRMPNGMLVTHFVLLKALLSDTEAVDDLAYEISAHLCQAFCQESDESTPEILVASNDHAYVLGSAVQRLCGIRCGVIDRVALLPGRRLTRETVSLDFSGKSAALLVDISATASEIERAASLLIHRGARLGAIVCAVWLECAVPRFVEAFRWVTLARPKRDLGFVYRSAP